MSVPPPPHEAATVAPPVLQISKLRQFAAGRQRGRGRAEARRGLAAWGSAGSWGGPGSELQSPAVVALRSQERPPRTSQCRFQCKTGPQQRGLAELGKWPSASPAALLRDVAGPGQPAHKHDLGARRTDSHLLAAEGGGGGQACNPLAEPAQEPLPLPHHLSVALQRRASEGQGEDWSPSTERSFNLARGRQPPRGRAIPPALGAAPQPAALSISLFLPRWRGPRSRSRFVF